MGKVMVIGLDGATWRLIKPWIAEGKLPALSNLMAKGTHGTLMSTMQPMSAQAWTSFMTGMNIGKHGLVDFLMRRPDSYDLQIVNARLRDGQSLWQLLGANGRQVAVINVPMTYPPERVNGVLVSGMDAPYLNPTARSNFTWPEAFGAELLQAVPDYVIEPGGDNIIFSKNRNPQRFIDEMLAAGQARFDAITYIMENRPWDFLMAVFRPTDRAQHFFWKHMDPQHPFHEPGDEYFADAITQVYEAVDRWLGALLDRVDEETHVVVMSDHGFEPLGKRVVYLNTWLRDQGFLQFRHQQSDNLQSRLLRNFNVSQLLWPIWGGDEAKSPV